MVAHLSFIGTYSTLLITMRETPIKDTFIKVKFQEDSDID